MNIKHTLLVLLFGAATPLWAQSTSPALNLQLPANAVAAPSKPAVEVKAKSDSPASASTTPATLDAVAMAAPYTETYGARRDADEKGCDDTTYAQPQLHGSVGMGVAAGNHFSGDYETATLVASKALGTCNHPKGDVAASITVTKGNINQRGRRSR